MVCDDPHERPVSDYRWGLPGGYRILHGQVGLFPAVFVRYKYMAQ
jgi:hypothetical protein